MDRMPRETLSKADELASGDFHVALLPNEALYCRSFNDPDDYVHEVEGRVFCAASAAAP